MILVRSTSLSNARGKIAMIPSKGITLEAAKLVPGASVVKPIITNLSTTALLAGVPHDLAGHLLSSA